ncbi:C39 family peptidase [Candidatus Riflebacteria bacterium]
MRYFNKTSFFCMAIFLFSCTVFAKDSVETAFKEFQAASKNYQTLLKDRGPGASAKLKAAHKDYLLKKQRYEKLKKNKKAKVGGLFYEKNKLMLLGIKYGASHELVKKQRALVARLEKERQEKLAGKGKPVTGTRKPNLRKPSYKPVKGKETSLNYPGIDRPEAGDNYCGQYAMTTILQGMGKKIDFKDVYKETNPAGIFTAPGIIVEYLNKTTKGAIQHNSGRVKDLVKQLDGGKPVMVLVDAGGTPHWVALTGYKTDTAGNITEWEMMDSYWGIGKQNRKAYKSHEDFIKMWKSPLGDSFLGKTSGYNNLWIEIGRKKHLFTGQPFSCSYTDLAAAAINSVVTGWKNKDAVRLGKGLCETIFSVPSVLLGGLGKSMEDLGDSGAAWGAWQFKEKGFFNKIKGGGAYLGSKAFGFAGTAVKSVGNAVAKVGKGAGWVVEKAGNGIKSVFNKLKFW